MNKPLRNDDTQDKHPDWNQSPNALAADGVTREDLNGIANLRLSRDHLPRSHMEPDLKNGIHQNELELQPQLTNQSTKTDGLARGRRPSVSMQRNSIVRRGSQVPLRRHWIPPTWHTTGATSWRRFKEFASFLGPGFLIAVAYIDPGNYATDVAAGAATQYSLLFVVLMSNVFAVVLQVLAIRLGTVTGKDLAQHCREHLPRWLNIAIYLLAEAAIIATDLAEVIGSAIALNLLFGLNLVAGCAITLIDVLLILLFYNPKGSLTKLRIFELCVGGLVIAVVVCFCIQLSLITGTTAGQVLYGYIPGPAVIDGQGIYLSCGILGATVMPHSIYLGSGLCQPRLQYYDQDQAPPPPPPAAAEITPTISHEDNNTSSDAKEDYIPSFKAIKHCLNYSTAELIVSLTGFALFVNSAILIVAGASLYSVDGAADADLFGIYALLQSQISRAAAIVFAVALFFSGTAAGIVCTIAGQMVSEGHIHWTIAPWLRRLLTRSISITPSIIIAASIGRDGLSAALNASQVALSIILPFVTAPLIWFTARSKYMTVDARPAIEAPGTGLVQDETDNRTDSVVETQLQTAKSMRNHWAVTILAAAIWLVITVMNVALLVLLGLGQS